VNKGLKSAITGLVSTAGTALAYATCIEPYAIETVRFELLCPHLPKSFDGYTILQISDLHMRQFGRRERMVARLAEGLAPDVIALTGDLVHTPSGISPFVRLANSLRHKDGAFAVYGNSEHKNGIIGSRFAEILEGAGVTPLLNKHTEINRGEDTIYICGVDDPVSEMENLKAAFDGVPHAAFKLLLMHSPDPVSEAAHYGTDVVLSGHTHGGQVRFPFIGAPFTRSLLGREMSSGYYAGKKLMPFTGQRKGRTQLYVSRGVGSSGLALRFLCPPEIAMITLRSL
jgi:predicted MPP superfamily phosphohydrolase